MIDALKCPTCGGPVRVREIETIAICLYCNGALKITRPGAGAPTVEVDSSISEESVEKVKALVLQGKRAEAVTLYRETAKCDQAAAESAIASYVDSAVTSAILSGTLNPGGMVSYVIALALFGASLYGYHLSESALPKIGCIALFALASLTLAVLTMPAVRTVRYLGATRAEAAILRHALIGKKNDVSSYLMMIQVREPSGATFETEIAFPVSKTGVEKVRVGRRFWVKYFPGDPKSIVFNGNIDP